MAIPVFIFANQRSGTNFLRNALASTGVFTDLNEIFQPNEPALFWTFYRDFINENPECIVPTVDNQTRIFDEFARRCIEPLNTEYALVDLKYNTTHNLNSQFQAPSEAPLIFDLIKRHRCKIIHLIRENSLENYVSNQLANQTKQYCAFEGDDIAPQKITLSAKQTILELIKCQNDIQRFQQYIAKENYDEFMEIGYAELSRLNDVTETYMPEKLKRFFNLSNQTKFQVKTRKIAKPPSEIISNYADEIQPALLTSTFAHFAH